MAAAGREVLPGEQEAEDQFGGFLEEEEEAAAEQGAAAAAEFLAAAEAVGRAAE